ncbi:hypothetical protein BH09MYX1_BH09MYX1_61290 [soil metagenome]
MQRKAPTRSEAILWLLLRDRFIVDLFAMSSRLVVEIDGSFHSGRASADAAREAEIIRLYDVRFVRVGAELVERDHEAALRHIASALR